MTLVKVDDEEGMGFSSLPIVSVAELVYRRIRSRILADMAPGSPLSLKEVAAELGVSTTPVRAAIEHLISDGLVVRENHKGAFIAPLSLADVLDVYAVREGLEGVASRLGAPRLTDEAIAGMRHEFAKLLSVRRNRSGEVDRYLQIEWGIHETCYEAAGRAQLLREIQSYRRRAERYFRLALSEGVSVEEDREQQKAFLAACEDRDGNGAELVSRALLSWTLDRVSPILH